MAMMTDCLFVNKFPRQVRDRLQRMRVGVLVTTRKLVLRGDRGRSDFLQRTRSRIWRQSQSRPLSQSQF